MIAVLDDPFNSNDELTIYGMTVEIQKLFWQVRQGISAKNATQPTICQLIVLTHNFPLYAELLHQVWIKGKKNSVAFHLIKGTPYTDVIEANLSEPDLLINTRYEECWVELYHCYANKRIFSMPNLIRQIIEMHSAFQRIKNPCDFNPELKKLYNAQSHSADPTLYPQTSKNHEELMQMLKLYFIEHESADDSKYESPHFAAYWKFAQEIVKEARLIR